MSGAIEFPCHFIELIFAMEQFDVFIFLIKSEIFIDFADFRFIKLKAFNFSDRRIEVQGDWNLKRSQIPRKR